MFFVYQAGKSRGLYLFGKNSFCLFFKWQSLNQNWILTRKLANSSTLRSLNCCYGNLFNRSISLSAFILWLFFRPFQSFFSIINKKECDSSCHRYRTAIVLRHNLRFQWCMFFGLSTCFLFMFFFSILCGIFCFKFFYGFIKISTKLIYSWSKQNRGALLSTTEVRKSCIFNYYTGNQLKIHTKTMGRRFYLKCCVSSTCACFAFRDWKDL